MEISHVLLASSGAGDAVHGRDQRGSRAGLGTLGPSGGGEPAAPRPSPSTGAPKHQRQDHLLRERDEPVQGGVGWGWTHVWKAAFAAQRPGV